MTPLETDPAPGYWRQWLQPAPVIAVVSIVLTLYVTQVIQSERLETMRVRLEVIERDYQRRDVLSERLQSIDSRLSAIERQLGERSPLIR